MSLKTYLVVGATGTQGGSVIKAILAAPDISSNLRILALTRSITSPKAQYLAASDPRIELIAGDTKDSKAIFETANTHIDSVFCVTVHGPAGAEEAQAEELIKASLAHGVNHFVFTSADRGGEKVSDTNPTPVPHIATKYRIEMFLKANTVGTDMRWTILRPVTFMDNLTPDFAGKGFAAMWNQVGKKPIQLVAASDIGYFAAKALLDPDTYAGRCIGIAGDELNFEQACEVFKRSMGSKLPQTFCVVGTVVKLAMSDIGQMFKWFEKDGYNVDIKSAREEYPGLLDFGTWLQTQSGFANEKIKT